MRGRLLRLQAVLGWIIAAKSFQDPEEMKIIQPRSPSPVQLAHWTSPLNAGLEHLEFCPAVPNM
jgi:hypothetical protein